MTMVGAASGIGPIMRYSRSASLMRRKPEGERVIVTFFQLVMAGLDPALHHFKKILAKKMDARVKPAHDELVGGSIPQLVALDLAGRGLRQRVDGLDPARIFPGPDLRLDVLLQRFIELIRLVA